MPQPDLTDYVEVHTRIERFYEKYPDGSLQSSWQLVEIAGSPLIIVEARAYRTPDDTRPGIGLASEPVPGKTPYTKDSELMNGETSAWGRALAALGFEIKRGIASGNEVRARGGGKPEPATQGQKDFLIGKGKRQGLFDKALLGAGQRKALIRFYCGGEELTKGGAGRMISALKEDPEKGAQILLGGVQQARGDGDENAQQALSLITSDVPADTTDLDAEEDLKGTPLEKDAA